MNFSTDWKNYDECKIDSKYLNGKIYKITHEGKTIYMGSTTTSLKDRLSRHRSASKIRHSPFYKFIFDKDMVDIKIELVRDVPCISKDELLTVENECIRNHGLNKLLNKNRPKVTDKEKVEQLKEYRESHKDERKEYLEAYYITNKDEFKAYQELHKDELKAYRELHKDKLNTRSKAYYIANKDEIKAQKNAKHDCQCGSQYAYTNTQRHFRSNKHLKFIATQTTLHHV
jgi:hypothetical protein